MDDGVNGGVRVSPDAEVSRLPLCNGAAVPALLALGIVKMQLGCSCVLSARPVASWMSGCRLSLLSSARWHDRIVGSKN